ncbi:hypothetical protein, partial [Actinoplanes lobatus]
WLLALVFALIGHIYCQIRGNRSKAETLWRSFARAHQELWLFAPPGLLLAAVRDWHSPTPWQIVFDAINLWNWWHYRNWPDDENRWKRRAKKAKEAVAVRAGRLVVVPST